MIRDCRWVKNLIDWRRKSMKGPNFKEDGASQTTEKPKTSKLSVKQNIFIDSSVSVLFYWTVALSGRIRTIEGGFRKVSKLTILTPGSELEME